MITQSPLPALGAVRRMTSVAPSIVGAVCAVSVLVASAVAEQTDPTGALVAALLLSTCVIGFTLDDEAAVTLASSPTTLRRRRSLAATIGLPPILVGWCAALVLVGAEWPALHIAVTDLAVEVGALALLTLAIAARWGGAAATIGAPVLALVMTVLATRYNGIPSLPLDSQWHDRWLLVAIFGLAWFIYEVRDPAAIPRRRRQSVIGRKAGPS
jgi:MFS family permease